MKEIQEEEDRDFIRFLEVALCNECAIRSGCLVRRTKDCCNFPLSCCPVEVVRKVMGE